MTLIPDDVRQVAFTVVMRGYDRAQVDTFLDQVEAGLTGLHGEVQRLVAENQQLAGENQQLRLQAAEANRAALPLAETLPPVPTASADGSAATGHIAQNNGAELAGYGRSIADEMRPGQ